MSNLQHRKSRPEQRFPIHTWIGLLILAGAELLLLSGQRFVITWFTPIMWTGYILAADGWLFRRTGASWLTRHRKEFLFLILASVGIWVLFEVYNFHLQNWYYQSVPTRPAIRLVSYFWSFATIIPGVFLTSQIVEDIISRSEKTPVGQIVPGTRAFWFLMGLAMVTIPLVVPVNIARYLFALVWIGFILLMDPINESIGAPSLRSMLEAGKWSKITALLLGGFLCGLLWEAWNFQAFVNDGGHWIYTVPEALRILGLHYGQMPALGMLGFPPFALELYVMYHFFRQMIEGPRLIGPVYW